jgi:hypothetical protein
MGVWRVLPALLVGATMVLLPGCGGGNDAHSIVLLNDLIAWMNRDIASEEDVPASDWESLRDAFASYAGANPADSRARYAYAMSLALWLGPALEAQYGDIFDTRGRSRALSPSGPAMLRLANIRGLLSSARNPRAFMADAASQMARFPFFVLTPSQGRSDTFPYDDLVDAKLQAGLEDSQTYLGILEDAFATARYSIPDFPEQGESLVVNLSAWAHTAADTPAGVGAPPDLKDLFPPLLYDDKDANGVIDLAQELQDFVDLLGNDGGSYDGEITGIADLPDPTLHGLFPDGLP